MSAAQAMSHAEQADLETDDDDGVSLGEIAAALRERLALPTVGPLVAGVLAQGITYLIAPTLTAVTPFMPPQQALSGAAAALAALGPLAGMAGGAGGTRNTGDRNVALMRSVTVSDHLIERFKLMDVYESKFRVDARNDLNKNVRISLGKKDGLINVAVDDTSPQQAAEVRLQVTRGSLTDSAPEVRQIGRAHV